MKKKLVSALLCATMIAGCFSMAGCGDSSDKKDTTSDNSEEKTDDNAGDTGEEAPEGGDDNASDTAAEEVIDFTDTYGDANGTHLNLWTFVNVHATFYGKMVDKWNAANPDDTIELTAIAYPFPDMHNKLLMSFQAGSGAPDICDIEIGQFPNAVEGLDANLVPLDDAMAEYKDVMVQSRIESYMGSDGHYYGAPFHVGATVMYYNMEELEAVGITQDDVDAVKTWDDWEALGKKYVEARGEDGKDWTEVDTGGTDWLWIAMAQCGEDWTGGFDGEVNVQLDSVKNMLTYQKRWLDDGIAHVCPQGQVDTDAGKQDVMDGNIVAFPKALWYMSRFINDMDGVEGKFYMAPCPTFKEGQPRSVGIGGTGTVVTQQSANPELAAKFLCYAKMSPEGEEIIWEELGFDVCNKSLWTDEAFAHDKSNKYNTFFRNMPYDVLNEISEEIGKISVVKASVAIGEQINITTLNAIFEDGQDVEEALQEAQEAIELEL